MVNKRAVGIKTIAASHGGEHAFPIKIERIISTQITLSLIEQKAASDDVVCLRIHRMASRIVPKSRDRGRIIT